MDTCLFCNGEKAGPTTTAGPQRIQTIISYSKEYGDELHKQLEEKLAADSNAELHCHRSCVSSYTSKETLRRFQKKLHQTHEGMPVPQKRLRRSELKEFNFKEHCIFCGSPCILEKDKKNPKRWRRVILCRTADPGIGKKSFKQNVLDTCAARGDDWAQQVRIRVEGAVSDLHAAEARYHEDCRNAFMPLKSVKAAASATESHDMTVDEPFETLLAEMSHDKSRIWNSVEVYNAYHAYGGLCLSRRSLLQKLANHFGDSLLLMTAPGVASILVFRTKASHVFKLVDDSEDDDLENAVSEVAQGISKELNEMVMAKDRYTTRINKDIVAESASETVLSLLAKLSEKLNRSLPAFMIGNMITSIVLNHPTPLQVSLGVLLRASKDLIHEMYTFGVTCSYDELLRFKKSAALATTKDNTHSGICDSKDGMVQVIADNFDADISSQNGKASTHSLAVLITQPGVPDDSSKETPTMVPRVTKTEMNANIEYSVDIERYRGSSKPDMPTRHTKKTVQSLKLLCRAAIASNRSAEADFEFVKTVLAQGGPEYSGYNTKKCRDQGHGRMPKTKAVYMPLIDMAPAEPDTVMTALTKAQQVTAKTGQSFTVFTMDQQLYRVTLNVIWTYPERFANVIPRLGGMHMLMSFVGAVGTLMADSGLAEILSSTFGGVAKMLNGKKFPQNVRAFRLLAEELLRKTVLEHQIEDYNELTITLDDLSKKSRTAKAWIENVIKPVFIMMMYVRAEREGDWLLHLEAVKSMLPYFFASGHVNYARYGLYYLRDMEAMPPDVQQRFMKGEHTMHHVAGIWNGIWSDMYIETTFMRYGHSHGGIIGITLKPETLKIWALSLHICSQLVKDIYDMSNDNVQDQPMHHKEESKARIAADSKDREAIRKKLGECIDPLNPKQKELVNIVSGQVAPSSVNIESSVSIGSDQMKEYEGKWPDGFYETLSKKVESMSVTRKHVKVGKTKVFDTNLIYSRVIGLQASSREIDIKKVLAYELAPVPTSMFTESGTMRIAKNKAQLKKLIQKEAASRKSLKKISSIVIDGSAVLWIINWPTSGTLQDYIDNFAAYIAEKLTIGDVYLIFDRYMDHSTKGAARSGRVSGISRIHQLSPHTPLPVQNIVLTVTENKIQLIDAICTHLSQDTIFHARHTQRFKLTLTGKARAPVEISNGGVVIIREDMATTHEEADNIIVQQMVMAAKESEGGIVIISDDTDVFVLLLHHYHAQKIKTAVIMESPVKGRKVIDIKATVEDNKNIVPGLLATHALSGCDTVATLFGIGKATAVKTLHAGRSLSMLGDLEAALGDVIQEAVQFVAACYGQPHSESMTEVRQRLWGTKMSKGSISVPKLCSLPPTTEAFIENVKRAHFQASIWRHALDPDPPLLDPLQYGWTEEENARTLTPMTVPRHIELAPPEILKLIKCSCESDQPCKTMRCGCCKAKLSCTIFCSCLGESSCCNELTKSAVEHSEDDDGET